MLAECIARIVGVYVLPVDTMVWLGTIAVTSVVGGGVAVGPMAQMIDAEVKGGDLPSPAVVPSLVAAR